MICFTIYGNLIFLKFNIQSDYQSFPKCTPSNAPTKKSNFKSSMWSQENTSNDVKIDEAININKLGEYAFAYGMLMLSVSAGILATSILLTIPLYGTFGCLTMLRCCFQAVAVAAAGLAAYAFFCYGHSNGIAKLRSCIQIGSLSIFFGTISFGTSGATSLILLLLGTLGNEFKELAVSVPLL